MQVFALIFLRGETWLGKWMNYDLGNSTPKHRW
jgi:hypothetical protein